MFELKLRITLLTMPLLKFQPCFQDKATLFLFSWVHVFNGWKSFLVGKK